MEEQHRLHQTKFRNRAELMTFAARHPGALSAFFLTTCKQQSSGGKVSTRNELKNVSTVAWATRHATVTDVRDIKEVLTLCAIMDQINQDTLPTAMDIASQRVLAIQKAKCKGGSWEKAGNVELVVPPGEMQTAAGMQKLTM